MHPNKKKRPQGTPTKSLNGSQTGTKNSSESFQMNSSADSNRIIPNNNSLQNPQGNMDQFLPFYHNFMKSMSHMYSLNQQHNTPINDVVIEHDQVSNESEDSQSYSDPESMNEDCLPSNADLLGPDGKKTISILP